MENSAYLLTEPTEQGCPIVFSSPHSGRDYPADFLANSLLNNIEIRKSEDAFVDQLFRSAPRYGAPLLSAVAPRAYVDLNRQADEFDAALIRGIKPNAVNPRLASGLGVIPRVVAEGRPIQSGKMDMAEAQERIEACYHPYHRRLQGLLDETRRIFGHALLLDCHSMPHGATANMVARGGSRPDIVLGDRFGASCARSVVDSIEAAFVAQGFVVSRNVPFAGAHIVQHYGRPTAAQYAVQIEIDRGLYMDEQRVEKSAEFDETQARIAAAVALLTNSDALELPLAAE
ncbi:N-formylglutamate amidohydrolase [Amylibacter marinus]|uniref:N-formylglutamate amidohydrolase n=1 Tax=Amylibacter marinus TaxID=1475483 RepID=A0ABQ5VXG0_9RHOB|nr:N-formylglutamate amidohydrolase [Amylibacter marinus]GLQ35773.1 N-formylglutamate amidohydrolase [Amylibacter marinus]